MNGGRDEWWGQWFDEDYLALYAHRDQAEADRFVTCLWRHLGLEPNSRVADVPCGSGRHSLAFARLGATVMGVDLSLAMLRRARAAARDLPRPPRFVRGDLRRIPAGGDFDVVANIFSSIGYFESESDNRAAFGELTRILRAGGTLVLDVINPVYLRDHFISETLRETPCGEVLERRTLDLVQRRVVKRIRIRQADQERSIHESVRLYDRSELAALAEEHGLRVSEFWGDYDGSECAADSPRIILLARK